MEVKNNKKMDLNFDLDEGSKSEKSGVDFLLEDKEHKKEIKEARVELVKKQIESNDNTTNVIQIDPQKIAQVAAYLKRKQTKDRKLQTYVTEEVFQAIQSWKRSVGLKKDTDAIESLLRLALGLKQI